MITTAILMVLIPALYTIHLRLFAPRREGDRSRGRNADPVLRVSGGSRQPFRWGAGAPFTRNLKRLSRLGLG